jgi:hypothetical protein
MYMIRHQNVMADPLAIMRGRTLPDFTQNLVTLRVSQEFPTLSGARREEYDGIVAK